MSATQICVIGSVNLDLVVRCETLPRPGETLLGGQFASLPGGKGANQALAARRLGAGVCLIGKVGRDAHAEQALALLRVGGVDLSACSRSDHHPTGVALITVAADGENQIVVAPGANSDLAVSDLPERIDTALIGQLEIPTPVLEAAVTRCTGFISLNLAPARPLPDRLIAAADLLVVNETEADFYGLEKLHASGAAIALTLGADGAILFRNGKEVARARPPEVVVVDTVGAGDAFVAAITLALIEGRPDDEALAYACGVGALATTRHGAQTGLPNAAEIATLMAATGEKS
ncbi:MAG: ribokinase [Hyphobacterium sp.]|nr:MAG: ribokinase [Hyphobacterium sp.]